MSDSQSGENLLQVPNSANVNTNRRTSSRSRSRQRDAPAQVQPKTPARLNAQEPVSAASEPANVPNVKRSNKKSKQTAAPSNTLLNPAKGSSKTSSRSPSPNPVDRQASQMTRKSSRKSICNEKDPKGDAFFEYAQSVAQHLKKKRRRNAKKRLRITESTIQTMISKLVMTFSSATWEDLPRIGVSDYHTVSGDALVSQVGLSVTKRQLPIITESVTRLNEALPELRQFVGTLNEAGSRQVIDSILFQAWKACHLLHIPLFARLELSVPSPVHPIVQEHLLLSTFISGRVDYGLSWSSQAAESFEQNSIQNLKQTISVLMEGREERETFSVLEAKPDEAKNHQKSAASEAKPDEVKNHQKSTALGLLHHLPQVLFECRGVPKEITKDS
ncbi:hypothetical protein ONZ45_g16115 [Pleurotus djamor]|nr:hypothetical protein ONZ45_g16115 [Pleurotus djamor]